jgi:hypothetical protein
MFFWFLNDSVVEELSNFFCKGVFMQKYVIGMMIVCATIFSVPVIAAPKQAMKYVVSRVSQTCDDLGSAIWKNKGGLAIGAVTTKILY